MAKAKESEKKEWPWSKYQLAIFDEIEHGNGNILVEACAGSGKSTTLVKCIDLVPSSASILVTAFNQDIVKELKKKVSNNENVFLSTLHSLGLNILRRNYPNEALTLDPFKYASRLRNSLDLYTSTNVDKMSHKGRTKYMANIKKLVDFGRYFVCSTVNDLDFICERYDIELIGDEKEVAVALMEWGSNELESIDYTDMIWLPNKLNVPTDGFEYDYIFLDECQDVNKTERELILRCMKEGSRLIAFGDSNQSIYGFAGSDPQSFDALKSLPNTKSLPLSISYRCADSIVEYARKLVPTIEPNSDGRKGAVIENVDISVIKDGDMVVCRNNAPLVQIYNEFLMIGKKAFVRGKDVGYNMKNAVQNTGKEELNVKCTKDGVFARLYKDLFDDRDMMILRYGIDKDTATKSAHIQNKLDMIRALEVLSEGINTTSELIDKIDTIFKSKGETDGIALSTVHKAKGLEADNVYIACRSLMPSKTAEKDWEKQQERNLIYVAYTRAKNTLGFIDEKGFEKFDLTSTATINELERIEGLIKLIVEKKSVPLTVDLANAVVKRARKVSPSVSSSKTITLSDASKKSFSINDIIGRNKLNIR